ncbi:hypothetical protein ACFL2V_00030 [Pseudomonadota bacterium]
MARPEPYIRRDPGDVIRSGDWNELQVQILEKQLTHRHTGKADGLKIPREGIEDKAIDGGLIDPEANVTVKALSVNGALKVNGADIVKRIDTIDASKADRTGGNITGPLHISKSLTVDENFEVKGTATLGYANHISDFRKPMVSGMYQSSGHDIPGRIPDGTHPWVHLINVRHSNPNNLHELQIASAYSENDRLFFRKLGRDLDNTHSPTWHEVATRGGNTFRGPQVIYRNNTINDDDNAFKIQTQHGYATFGSLNSGWFHMHTDRPGFYFSKPAHASGGFHTYSTKKVKKDIAFIDDEEERDFLNLLADTKIAKFRYRDSALGDKLHIGVIAEEAPTQMLSEQGDSVNLYDYISIGLVAIKALKRRVDELQARMDVVSI